MLLDLSPYVSFDTFAGLWIIAMLALAALAHRND